jgi:hypothetical protein
VISGAAGWCGCARASCSRPRRPPRSTASSSARPSPAGCSARGRCPSCAGRRCGSSACTLPTPPLDAGARTCAAVGDQRRGLVVSAIG